MLLLGLVLGSVPIQASTIETCVRKVCLMGTGVACFAERLPLDGIVAPVTQLVLRRRKKDKRVTEAMGELGFATTRRGPIEYFDNLGLYSYDFSNKQILDIGSGKSRFAQMVNLTYGGTGTKATTVDLYNTRPLFSQNTPHVRGDAFALPFADKAFDLTVNSWMLNYYLPHKFADGEKGQIQMKYLSDLVLEQLRATADGGQAKVGIGFYPKMGSSAGLAYVQHLLENHPRVESFQINRPFPFIGGTLEVKMKPETAESARVDVPNRFPENPNALAGPRLRHRGLMVLPTLIGGTTLWAGLSRLKREYDRSRMPVLSEQINSELLELEEIAEKKLGYRPEIRALEVRTHTEAKNTLAMIAKMRTLYQKSAKENLVDQRIIQILHGQEVNMGSGLIFLNSADLGTVQKLLKVP